MGHRYRGARAHSPALVGGSEGRRRAADGIYVVAGVVGVYHCRRGAPFGHRLVVEGPELVPGGLDFGHEERRHGHLALGAFVVPAEGFCFGGSHCEGASGNGYHPDGGCSAGNGLGEVLEGAHLGACFIHGACGHGGCLHALVLVVGVEVACVEVAAYALQVVFLLVFFVVEMGHHGFVADSLGIEVDVALAAALVVDYLLRVGQLALGFPVYLFLVLEDHREHIFHSHPGLDGEAVHRHGLGRKMAGHAVCHGAGAVGVVHRLLPAGVGVGVHVAGHTVFVGRSLRVGVVEACHKGDTHCDSAQESRYDPFLLRHYCSIIFIRYCPYWFFIIGAASSLTLSASIQPLR